MPNDILMLLTAIPLFASRRFHSDYLAYYLYCRVDFVVALVNFHVSFLVHISRSSDTKFALRFLRRFSNNNVP